MLPVYPGGGGSFQPVGKIFSCTGLARQEGGQIFSCTSPTRPAKKGSHQIVLLVSLFALFSKSGTCHALW
jgi:hypothetical protein